MKALPYERFVVQSSESVSALVARLQSSVAKAPTIREMWEFGRKPQSNTFYGSVDPGGFRIWRSLRYRNSFLPLAIGRISAQGSGSTIEVTVRPARFGAKRNESVRHCASSWKAPTGSRSATGRSAAQDSSDPFSQSRNLK